MKLWKLIALLALSGCFQAYDEEDELRTVPVTNNPHLVPDQGGRIPGFSSEGPY